MLSRTRAALFFFLVLAGCGPAGTAAADFPTPIRWQSPTVSPSRFPDARSIADPNPRPDSHTPDVHRPGGGYLRFDRREIRHHRRRPDQRQSESGSESLSIGTVLIIPSKPAGTGTPQPTPDSGGAGPRTGLLLYPGRRRTMVPCDGRQSGTGCRHRRVPPVLSVFLHFGRSFHFQRSRAPRFGAARRQPHGGRGLLHSRGGAG